MPFNRRRLQSGESQFVYTEQGFLLHPKSSSILTIDGDGLVDPHYQQVWGMASNKTEFKEIYICDHFHTVMEAVEYDSETNEIKFGQDMQ